jgi:hypothetical protein
MSRVVVVVKLALIVCPRLEPLGDVCIHAVAG